MPMNRCTFFFKDVNNFGWTETFHNTLPTLPEVLAKANILVPLRVGLLGNSATLAYVRVSDDDVFRDSQIQVIEDPQGIGTFTGNTAFADVCLLVRTIPNPAVTSQVRKLTYLRGLPKGILGAADTYTPRSSWNAAFGSWATELVNGNWAIKTVNRLLVPFVITGAVQNVVTGLVTVTTSFAHGLTVGQGVRISGVAGASEINGVWNVQTIPSLTSFTILITAIMGPYVAGGIGKGIGYQLQSIFRVIDERTAHRKAGRPFDSAVGRRKRRTGR